MKKTSLLATAIIPLALLVAGCETTGLSTREQHNGYAANVLERLRSS